MKNKKKYFISVLLIFIAFITFFYEEFSLSPNYETFHRTHIIQAEQYQQYGLINHISVTLLICDDENILIDSVSKLRKLKADTKDEFLETILEQLDKYEINPNLDIFRMLKDGIKNNKIKNQLAIYRKVDLPELKQTNLQKIKEIKYEKIVYIGMTFDGKQLFFNEKPNFD
ncbi:hypothetical protein AAEX28_01620 [Lentisphaerota bacterium WC36G]|nr:hypothetical protein LJT99_04505 [Lentisphaerae bacterium WC36]